MTEREFDVVLYGATGFTGQLTAAYLAREADESGSLRWAIAGRSRSKLDRVRAELGLADSVGTIVASSDDIESLREMAARSSVVATTVGPYAKYGLPLVEACVDERTHYADITGEPDFVREVRQQFDPAAKTAGVRLVSCCGFDSVPHDLGAFMTARHLPGEQPMRIRGVVRVRRGGFSGGTWHSALNAMRDFPLLPKTGGGKRTKSERRAKVERSRVHRVDELGGYAFPLPTIDPKVVVRSARELEEFGPDFSYGHYGCTRRLRTLVGGGVAIGGIAVLAKVPPARRALERFKQPGDGPSAALRAKTSFDVTFFGQEGGHEVVTRVSGGDPGYTETAKMLGESAICLALDPLDSRGGALTPAVAMGELLQTRLERAGMRFEVLRS